MLFKKALLLLLFRSIFSYLYNFCSHDNLSGRFPKFVSREIGSNNFRLCSTRSSNSEMAAKRHSNKYSKFSKNNEDPLANTIKRVKEEENQELISKSMTIRGTTIPSGSDAVETSPSNFEDIKKIVPTDPSTFGYTLIGLVSGAHGVKGEVKVQIESDFADYRMRKSAIVYLKRPNRNTPRPIKVTECRKTVGNTYLLQLSGVSSRLHANAFKGFSIYSKTSDRPTLSDNEYLVKDLVDMPCYVSKYPDSENVSSIIDSPVVQNNNYSPEMTEEEFHNIFLCIGKVSGVVLAEDLCSSPSVKHLMHDLLEIKLLPACHRNEDHNPDINEHNDDTDERNMKDLCLIPMVPSIVTYVDLTREIIIVSPPAGLLDLTYREREERVVIRGYLPAEITHLTASERQELESASIVVILQ